jgi:hypothetical protein
MCTVVLRQYSSTGFLRADVSATRPSAIGYKKTLSKRNN